MQYRRRRDWELLNEEERESEIAREERERERERGRGDAVQRKGIKEGEERLKE